MVLQEIGGKLGHYQTKHEGVLTLVAAEERTRISQQTFDQTCLRLKEIMRNGRTFGGCTAVLLSDPRQLLPARSDSLWIGVK